MRRAITVSETPRDVLSGHAANSLFCIYSLKLKSNASIQPLQFSVSHYVNPSGEGTPILVVQTTTA